MTDIPSTPSTQWAITITPSSTNWCPVRLPKEPSSDMPSAFPSSGHVTCIANEIHQPLRCTQVATGRQQRALLRFPVSVQCEASRYRRGRSFSTARVYQAFILPRNSPYSQALQIKCVNHTSDRKSDRSQKGRSQMNAVKS